MRILLIPLSIITFIGFSAARAQVSTDVISLNISGAGTSDTAAGVSLSGSGTVDPFGTVSVAITSTAVSESTTSIPLTFSFTFNSGGTLLAISSGSASANEIIGIASISAGTGQFQGASGSFGYSMTVPAESGVSSVQFSLLGDGAIALAGAATDSLVVSRNLINFSGTQPQTFEVLALATALSATSIAVKATVSSPVPVWLTVSEPAERTSNPALVIFTLSLNPVGLAPGVYTTQVTVTSTPSGGTSTQVLSQVIQITLVVPIVSGQPAASLLLSQTGLQFISAGTAPPAQQILISANTPGLFSTIVTTGSGGSWLSVNPASGSASISLPSTVSVQANPQGLAPGTYFGRIDFSAGSPAVQSVVVVFTVENVDTGTLAVVSPDGLLFAATPGSSSAAQTVQVNDVSNSTLIIDAGVVYQQGSAWLTVGPGVSPAPGQQQSLPVSVNAAGLAPGIYRATVTLQVLTGASTQINYPVPVVLVVPSAASPCISTQLIPIFTSLTPNFVTTAAYPLALDAAVIDDCGTPLTAGTVSASFSNGDPDAMLTSAGNGQWDGTWNPHDFNGGPVTATLLAANSSVSGYLQLAGTVVSNGTTPVVGSGGVVSAANFAPYQPAAPGTFLAIFGSNLSTSTIEATSLPLGTQLAGTEVFLGGVPIPIEFAGPEQINAIVPLDAPVGSILPLVVSENGQFSMIEPVFIADVQPAVFNHNGAAIVDVVEPTGGEFVAGLTAPATAGDIIVIYASGLGAVSPPSGISSETGLQVTVNPVTVSIGGQSAQVQFAGLAPDLEGLYQVNVLLPAGVETGPDVPLILTVAGTSSIPVALPIQ